MSADVTDSIIWHMTQLELAWKGSNIKNPMDDVQ